MKAKAFSLYAVLFSPIIFLLVLVCYHIKSTTIHKRYEDESKLGLYTSETEPLKYILLWSSPRYDPVVCFGAGREAFIGRNCPHTNCFVTRDRNMFYSYTKFDAIVFLGTLVTTSPPSTLPQHRALRQKYVFASIESAHNYPVCSTHLNDFFNWTWTYKLDSDAQCGFIVVRNNNDEVIGPKKVMNWIKLEDMELTSDDAVKKLNRKTKAAAWFVSNCNTKSKREIHVEKMRSELERYNLSIDIYGECGPLKCSKDNMEDCLDMIERDYYFYLSFENAFSEDYVTGNLLLALNHYAVPIVFGGANYTRFMPDGIYLNAIQMEPMELARKIYTLINNPEEYQKYFRWHNHYKYHRRIDRVETDDYCRFCSMLNDEQMVQATTVYEDFKNWWTPPHVC